MLGGCADSRLVDDHAECVAANPPVIALRATADAVRIAGGLLRARYTFDDRLHGRRSWYRVPRIALELVTPTDNVASAVAAHEVRETDRSSLHLSFTVGLMYGAVGGLLVGLGIHERVVALDPVGGVMFAIGAGLAGDALLHWNPDEWRRDLPLRD